MFPSLLLAFALSPTAHAGAAEARSAVGLACGANLLEAPAQIEAADLLVSAWEAGITDEKEAQRAHELRRKLEDCSQDVVTGRARRIAELVAMRVPFTEDLYELVRLSCGRTGLLAVAGEGEGPHQVELQMPAIPLADRCLRSSAALIEASPSTREANEARYLQTVALRAAGKLDEAADAAVGLLKADPGSSWAPAAWAVVGDFHLSQDHPDKARTAYERAASLPGDNGSPRAYARFREAWAAAATGDKPAAVESFGAVLRSARPGGPLFEAALASLPGILVGAQGGAKTLSKLVEPLDGGARLADSLDALATQESLAGNTATAMAIWEDLADRWPEHPKYPTWARILKAKDALEEAAKLEKEGAAAPLAPEPEE